MKGDKFRVILLPGSQEGETSPVRPREPSPRPRHLAERNVRRGAVRTTVRCPKPERMVGDPGIELGGCTRFELFTCLTDVYDGESVSRSFRCIETSLECIETAPRFGHRRQMPTMSFVAGRSFVT